MLKLCSLIERILKKYHIYMGLIPNERHIEHTYLLNLDMGPSSPTEDLLNICVKTIINTITIDNTDISMRYKDSMQQLINTWPGEHYKLLGGLVKTIKPNKIIEIGTYTGASCLVMKKYLPENGKIITYDVLSWHNFPNTGLEKLDFDSRLEQRNIDLSIIGEAKSEIIDLKNADIIFVDAKKDGVMEKSFCELFDQTNFVKSPIVVFDDIRLLNMVNIWDQIKHPKIDLTSFGHWSGTGIVKWE